MPQGVAHTKLVVPRDTQLDDRHSALALHGMPSTLPEPVSLASGDPGDAAQEGAG
jgi:hypothetical protein